MSTPSELYPLATSEGQAIPLDVVRPLGTILAAFSSVGSTPHALPTVNKIYVLCSTEDCYVLFDNATATVPAADTYVPDMLFLPANMLVNIIPSKGYYSVISASGASGKLMINCIETWHGLSLSSQITRR